MSLYHPVNRGGVVAIAICDRCRKKFNYTDLRADGDAPGLRVCKDCCDEKDPYKLPARQTENITLRYPRSDQGLYPDVVADYLLTEDSDTLSTEDDSKLIVEQ